MMRIPLSLPAAALWAALAAAGCDNPDAIDEFRLDPAQVAGTYRLCALRFTPSQGALPAADLLAGVIDPDPAAGKPGPALTLSGTAPAYQMVYTRRRDATVQQLQGLVEFGGSSVFLHLYSDAPSTIPREALLPPSHLDLVFHPGERRLTAGAEVSAYWVRRADYARAAGISEEGLLDRIWGHVTALFVEGECP
jgi:hypothetical protein